MNKKNLIDTSSLFRIYFTSLNIKFQISRCIRTYIIIIIMYESCNSSINLQLYYIFKFLRFDLSFTSLFIRNIFVQYYQIDDSMIAHLKIPNGIPLVYTLDENLEPILDYTDDLGFQANYLVSARNHGKVSHASHFTVLPFYRFTVLLFCCLTVLYCAVLYVTVFY